MPNAIEDYDEPTIKSLEGRVRTVTTEVNYLQRGLNDVRNMSFLLPLLSTPSSRTLNDKDVDQGGTLQIGDKVLIDTSDNLSRILPLLLFSGGWGQSGSGGGMFGGDNSGIMMLAVILALQDK
jgi:hypothetical protein